MCTSPRGRRRRPPPRHHGYGYAATERAGADICAGYLTSKKRLDNRCHRRPGTGGIPALERHARRPQAWARPPIPVKASSPTGSYAVRHHAPAPATMPKAGRRTRRRTSGYLLYVCGTVDPPIKL